MLQNADEKPGDNINAGDDDAGDGVALGKTRSSVHGAVEFRFPAQFAPPAPRFSFIDQPAVQVGIDRHLLAGHGVQGEARGYFRNTDRTVVDDDILDGDQHGKNGEVISRREAIAIAVVNEALRGNQKAFSKFMKLMHRSGLMRRETSTTPSVVFVPSRTATPEELEDWKKNNFGLPGKRSTK